MKDKIKDFLKRLLAVDRRVLIAATAGLVGIMVLGIIGLNVFSTTNYSLLYGDLSQEDSRQIVRVLDRGGLEFETRLQGAEIAVPAANVNEIRILLAEEGLPSKGTIGYEIFDDQDAIGTSNLAQEINQLRAIEGEIARTIGSIDKVQSARVHIVLPKRELFSRERQEPSASVVVNTIGNQTLDRGQVQAILHIVAAAVPGLNTDSVTIADDRGELLARGGGSNAAGGIGGQTPEEIQTAYETTLARRLEAILENVIGRDKVRAEVRAEMDFSQTVINEEDYNPDRQVIRSEEFIEENSSRSITPNDAVTVQNNIPENQLLTQGQLNENEQSSRTEERINYEISKIETNQIIPPGRLDRLSVAVLVDGVYVRTGNNLEYQPRTAEEMIEIERLVKSAIGYNNLERQDLVEIVNLRFSTSNIIGTETEATIYGIPVSDFRDVIEQLILSIVILLILFWVVRPLIMRLIGTNDDIITKIGPDGIPIMINRKTGEPIKALENNRNKGNLLEGAVGEDGEGAEGDDDEYVNLVNLRSKIKGNVVKKLNALINKYPLESTAALREWSSQK